jgi:trimeric autotransporter adhesin
MQLRRTPFRGNMSFRNAGSLVIASMLCAEALTVPLAAQTPAIVSVTLSPATIAGGSGDSSTGTLTLSAPAPSGGVVVTLASSNIELAATRPSVRVESGATSATFTVATNRGYRRYSNLAFSATISATVAGSTRGATLNVTAQPRPPDFNSGSTAGANTQWSGLMCGGLPPIGGYQGILYNCSPADASGFGTCTFQQECSLGCRRVPPNGGTFRDFCATTGPNPVAIGRNNIVSGDRVPGTIVLEAPAGQGVDQEVGEPGVIDEQFNASDFPHANGGIVFPDGATTVPFAVATSYVPAIQWVQVEGFWFNDSIPPLLITNGRAGHTWLVMIPPDPAPPVAMPTLGDFTITGPNPVTGGERTFGSVDLSGLSRIGGPTLTLTSSHPSIVPSTTIEAPANENLLGFQMFFDTVAPDADTDVTVTVSDGRYSFSDVLTVRKAPPPPVLSGVSVNPTSVVGGSSATGRVTLSAPQSGPTVVQVSIIDGAPATLPTNDPPCPPSSRCHNVTVPAGATSANFTIRTSPVTSQFNLNIFAHLADSPGRQALLLITPGGSTTVKAVTIDPVSMVGGASATGTVTLTGAAPSGGAVVTLAKALSDGGAGSVPVTIPTSVTVPGGQTTASFTIASSSVTTTTNVRISGTFGGLTANADMSLFPLLGQVLFSGNIPGGNPAPGSVHLNGPAPAGGAVVTLSSGNTSLATVPASVTVPAGQTSAAFTANTSPVTQTTAVVISGSHGGRTVTTNLFLVVSRAVSSVTLNPSTVVGPASSTGTVTLRSAAPSGNAVVELVSSNTVFATVPFSVVVPSGRTSATFAVNAAQVTTTTSVVISATYENVTRTATLTINPPGSSSAAPAAPTLVAPANGATGVAQPTTLDWNDVTSATSYEVQVDDSSTIAAPFVANPTVTASQAPLSGLPARQLWWRVRARNASGVFGSFSSVRTFTPQSSSPPPTGTATLSVTASGRSGERVTSSPVGINVPVGSAGSAVFNTGTSITLSVTNGRDAIWSGACSSGGSKRRTCTFTLNSNASVSVNVQ